MGTDIYINTIAILVGILGLQVILVLLGLSDMEADVDGDMDLDGGFEPDVSPETGLALVSADVPEGVEIDVSNAPDAVREGQPEGFSGLIGLRGVPFMIWASFLLGGFSVTGLFLSGILRLPESFTVPGYAVSALGALFSARLFGRAFRRWLPGTESYTADITAIRRQRGKIILGDAMRHKPARVLIHDRFGNRHYMMVEPLEDDKVIPDGSDVLVVRCYDIPTDTVTFRAVEIA